MKDEQIKIYNMLKACFRGEKTPTHCEVAEKAKLLSDILHYELNDKELAEIIEDYEINVKVRAFDPDSIVIETMNSEWFQEKKNDPNMKHDYWSRYEDYLRDEKDFDEDTVIVLKRSTEEILGYCANPTPKIGEVKKRRGLVVGDVQSGKTANYMALINMACDYGYKLIIILAGLTDSLRMQTQERVDEGLIGAISDTIGSKNITYIGVGTLKKERYAVTLTNLEKDFKRESMAALNNTTADYNKPVVLVVKKNKSTLENVKEWLKPGTDGVTDHILIIDDEADNASVNTKKAEEDPSAINRLIRDLYNNFPKASYVGYTATPFANIFINPDDDESYRDLFPSDFITLLKTPTSYFGAEKVFGVNNDGNTRYLRELDEEEPLFLPVSHKKDDEYYGLPDSLKEAIQTFYINSVIRTKRGKPYAHRSMMINISRFNKMQTKIKRHVLEYVENLKNIISQTSYQSREKFLRNKEMLSMYNLYMTDEYYDLIREEITWDEIQSRLAYEADRMKVIVVNRLKDEEKLDYRSYKNTGARYIVIGGFVLSRGLTLECLMVSYYSRNGSAYDSLMQMCRWFGYRPKYEDLCRVYMSEINKESFGAVIDATNDLKQQFREMKMAKKTPNEYGLMVKTCPDVLNTLLVTSRNKSRTTVDRIITLNYSTQTIDTSKIFWDVATNNKNLKILENELQNKFGDLKRIGNRYMYRSVDKETIISILQRIEFPYENTKLDTISICKFLEESNRLNLWDVVIATGNVEADTRYFSFGGNWIPSVKRKFNYRKKDNEPFVRIAGNNNRLMDPGILNSGLDQKTVDKIMASTGGKTPGPKDYLKRRRNPIFVIYPIDLKVENGEVSKSEVKNQLGDNFLIGIGIGFPYNGEGISITYKLNKRRQEELERERELMEDEDDE